MIKNNISSLSVLAGLFGISMIRKKKFSSKNEAHDSIMDVKIRFKVEYSILNMEGTFEYSKKDYENILFEEYFFASYKAYLEVNDRIYFNPALYNDLDDEDEEMMKEWYLEILGQRPDIDVDFLGRVEYRLEDWDIDSPNDFGVSSPRITEVDIIENNEETYVDISYSYDLIHFYAFLNNYKDIKEGVLVEFNHFEGDMINLIGMHYTDTEFIYDMDGHRDISDLEFTVISTDIKIHTDNLSKMDRVALSGILSNSELRKF